MDQIQNELNANYPELDVQILGVNIIGAEIANDQMSEGRDLPWLQDVDEDNDEQSDVWRNSWDVSYRDVVVVNADNVKIGTYNLTIHDLKNPDNYATMRDMFIEAASDDFEMQTDVTSTLPDTAVDVLALHNDTSTAHPGLALRAVISPENGTAEVMTIDYSPDLDPKGNTAPLIISEVSPGNFIELFNTTNQVIQLNTVTQQLSSPSVSHSVAELAADKSVGAHSYVTLDWPSDFTDTDAGGEILLYRDDLTGFGDAGKIDDVIAWGSNPHDSRLALAEEAGSWSGQPAPALAQGSIQRLPGTNGAGASAYNTTRSASPGQTLDTEMKSMQVVRYHPDAGFTGQETIKYTALDSNGEVGMGMITINVSADAKLWRNPVDSLDVDNNGLVQPLDVLQVINDLNQRGSRFLPASLVAPFVPPPFVDSSGNGLVEPLDVLLVINRLNEPAGAEGEGTSSIVAAPQVDPGSATLSAGVRVFSAEPNSTTAVVDEQEAASAAVPDVAGLARLDNSILTARSTARPTSSKPALEPLLVDAVIGLAGLD